MGRVPIDTAWGPEKSVTIYNQLTVHTRAHHNPLRPGARVPRQNYCN